jgi:hypothetical protein
MQLGAGGGHCGAPGGARPESALGDGSVRFISASISSSQWVAACDPRDGLVPN